MNQLQFMAKVYTSKNKLQQPLLGSDDETNPDESNPDEQNKKRTQPQSLLKGFTYSWSSTLVILSIGSIILEPVTFVFYFMLFSIGLATYAVVQRSTIEGQHTVRQEINELTQKARELAEECERLSEYVGTLKADSDKVKELEGRLMNLVEEGQTEDLLNLVKENRKINQKKKIRLMQTSLQGVFSLILESDNNRDNDLSGNEIRHLVLRLKQIRGMETFDEEKFEEVMSRSKNDIYTFVNNVGIYWKEFHHIDQT